eukprot:TRINITY_DN642_c5_g1_i1.p1 TRINITY_DN642_c5_g1~~TRINITY_DN642_c5_g1_i1.p1  ORF type:complete len:329 (-),score=52.32 TRINITY_DN642_c5_g1_i1:39-1025(-)
MNVWFGCLLGFALTAYGADTNPAACEGESCDASFSVEDEMYKVSLLQYPIRAGKASSTTKDQCGDGGWNHCWDDACANAKVDRRRRYGSMGHCRRRTGFDSSTTKCCGNIMYYKSPAPPPPPENCEEGGWSHCWDDSCANSMFERRRRYGSMGQCRRRNGRDSPSSKCCGDKMYYKSSSPPPPPPPSTSPTPVPSSAQNKAHIKHVLSSRCMSVKDGTKKLELHDCDGSNGQEFVYKNSKIKTHHGKKCVAVKGKVEAGGKLHLEDCDNSDKQKWELSPNGWFKSKADSHFCIDVEGTMNTANGASLQVGECALWTLMSDQRWEVVDA